MKNYDNNDHFAFNMQSCPFLSQLHTQGGCSGTVAELKGGTIPVSSKVTLQANQISGKGAVLFPSFFPGSGAMVYQNLYAYSK
jgi:hypothetical protein